MKNTFTQEQLKETVCAAGGFSPDEIEDAANEILEQLCSFAVLDDIDTDGAMPFFGEGEAGVKKIG